MNEHDEIKTGAGVITTPPTAEDIRDAFDKYEEMGPQGCVIELIASLDHLAEHDAVASELATKVRELFGYSERSVPDRHVFGDVIVPYTRTVQKVAALDDIEARVKSDIATKQVEEEDRAARMAVRQ